MENKEPFSLKDNLFLKWLCQLGLHLLHYRQSHDGYVCFCGWNHLWCEEIRED